MLLFLYKDRTAVQLVKKNVALLGAGDKSTIRIVSAPDFPPAHKKYDFIFLDPPYHLDIISETLSGLNDNNYVSDNCMAIAESAAGDDLIIPDYFEIIKEKTYGDARFSFLKKIS